MSTSIMTLPSHMAGFLHELGPPGGGVYSFVSHPSALLMFRPKYRNEQTTGPVNIMHDRRVVRGNTYSTRGPLRSMSIRSTLDENASSGQHRNRHHIHKRVLPNIGGGRSNPTSGGLVNSAGSSTGQSGSSSGGGDHFRSGNKAPSHESPSAEAKYAAARARVRRRLSRFHDKAPPSNGEAKGRGYPQPDQKSMGVQSADWLEEIDDKHLETDEGVQTDHVSTGKYSPISGAREAIAADGVDKATQILPNDPELYLFDEEVVIILEALVGRTLEQSLVEVIQDEELALELKTQLILEHQHLLST